MAQQEGVADGPPPGDGAARDVVVAEPRVRLVAHTARPYEISVASARTCYAADFVFVGRLGAEGEKRRTTLLDALPSFKSELDDIGRLDTPHERRIETVDRLARRIDSPDIRAALSSFALLAYKRSQDDARIAHGIYGAGHHTPFQHPTFVFALEGMSRLVVESFLHNHTFYNSEQQSQRYVEMKRADVHVPASVREDPTARSVYEEAVRAAWDAYHDLRERLVAANVRTMEAVGRVKGQSDKEIRREAGRKAQEMARYVLPVAAATQLYHTVSGIVLLRYIRMCEAGDGAREARAVVEQMVEEVRRVDPAFVAEIQEQARPRAQHAEHELAAGPVHAAAAELPLGTPAVLVAATPDAPRIVVQALREVTGSVLPEDELLAAVLDPARNAALADTLNTWDHSPALRTLRHVHYTFRKRLSLTAFAQDQRHRMTPGTRPLLARLVGAAPDVHVPEAIAADPAARQVFDRAIRVLHAAMASLRARGVPAEDCAYLLPNATNVTFTQSGDLLSFMHKWRLRTCFNAQKEIFDASIAELRQAQALHPQLTRWLGPPCSFVAPRQPASKQGDPAACCPEGDKWCGVKVWLNFDAAKGIPKRPF